MSKIVLGKGLDALISADGKKAEYDKKYKMVSLEHLAPNPMQPRRDFNEDDLKELAESFKTNGIIQPLVVKENGGAYVIVAGERRFRAARLAGLEEVPVLVMGEVDDTRMLELALVENLQRENLNAVEVAEAYRMLIDKCDLTQKELAEKVGKSRTAVTNVMRLLSLPDSIKNMIREGRITEGHARAILALDNENEMLKMAEQIVNNTLTVREVEKVSQKKRKRKLTPKRKAPVITEFETYLKRLLGTSVKITHGLKGGKIKIEYYNDDDLERLMDLFRRAEQ